jgi:hypothetical protein
LIGIFDGKRVPYSLERKSIYQKTRLTAKLGNAVAFEFKEIFPPLAVFWFLIFIKKRRENLKKMPCCPKAFARF